MNENRLHFIHLYNIKHQYSDTKILTCIIKLCKQLLYTKILL